MDSMAQIGKLNNITEGFFTSITTVGKFNSIEFRLLLLKIAEYLCSKHSLFILISFTLPQH